MLRNNAKGKDHIFYRVYDHGHKITKIIKLPLEYHLHNTPNVKCGRMAPGFRGIALVTDHVSV